MWLWSVWKSKKGTDWEGFTWSENYNLWNDFPVNMVVEILLVTLNLKRYLQGGKIMLVLGFQFFSLNAENFLSLLVLIF